MKIGYFLSCEEYSPAELLQQATLAEAAGFESLWISDHFTPGLMNKARVRLSGR
jgi:alkanesulfonate monooxygenase SsuD/methylene tetrahydromethanopterin reductase-like flavin-dependent oxidoreductase (luciferase family)